MFVAMRSLMLYRGEFISFSLTASHSSLNGNIICFYQHMTPNNHIFILLLFFLSIFLRVPSCGNFKRTLATWTVMVLCRLCISLFCVLCNNVEQLCSWFIQFESEKKKERRRAQPACVLFATMNRRERMENDIFEDLCRSFIMKDSFASPLYERVFLWLNLLENVIYLDFSLACCNISCCLMAIGKDS